jgi:hypothetical protein
VVLSILAIATLTSMVVIYQPTNVSGDSVKLSTPNTPVSENSLKVSLYRYFVRFVKFTKIL